MSKAPKDYGDRYGAGLNGVYLSCYDATPYVYVALRPSYGVKIGHTSQMYYRIHSLRKDYGQDLTIEYVRTGAKMDAARVERRAHAILESRHIIGEWFDASVLEAKFAVNDAYMQYVLDDTTAMKRSRIYKKRIPSIPHVAAVARRKQELSWKEGAMP